MGYNRSGVRRSKRLKRAKRHEERLARKAAEAAPPEGGPPQGHGLVAGVKSAVAGVAHAVGATVQKVADAVTGKKEETPPQ